MRTRCLWIVPAFFPLAAGCAAQGVQPGLVLVDTAVLQSPVLDESSGVVPSTRRPGVYWSLNDSGNRPLLIAFDTAGRDLGFVAVSNARAVDWEELSSGRCLADSAARCLYIADIGDNRMRRRSVAIYVVPEPDPPQSPSDTTRVIVAADSLVLTYPGEPHDAEAMVVRPSGEILLITKDRSGPPLLFRVPAGTRSGTVTLERVGALPIATSMARGRLVTGAALSHDDRLLAVRTYVSIHLFRLAPAAAPQALHPRAGVVIPVVESQGEAITFDGPGRLLLTSERGASDHGIITRLRITGLTAP